MSYLSKPEGGDGNFDFMHEVGVLTAVGMKKGKVAMQFLSEILIVTILAVVIGAGIGAISSVPVTKNRLNASHSWRFFVGLCRVSIRQIIQIKCIVLSEPYKYQI